MISLDNVTLFCISSDNVDGALKALQYSMKGINYGAVKLITHEEPDNLPQGIEFSECYEITSIHEYNYYCIYNLTRHIDTDYCLLVQPDGFESILISGLMSSLSMITSVRLGRR